MVKLEDIARVTGYNVSTVSRALKGKLDISLETRKKVKLAAAELGYEPRDCRNKMIGVLLPEVRSQYYSNIVHTLERKLRSKGYSMIYMLTGFTNEGLVNSFHLLCNQGVAGLIVNEASFAGGTTDYELLSKTGLPTVMLSNVDIGIKLPVDSIRLSTENEMRLAIEHLIELGHRKIGFIGEYMSNVRYNVLRKVMPEYGLELNEAFIMRGSERFEQGGYLRAQEMIKSGKLPTAVIASYDQVAVGAMKAFGEAGLAIPGDVSIIGVDDIVVDDYLPVRLTSITSPAEQMAVVAVKLLLDNINDPDEHVVQTVELQSKLVERDSTAAPKDNENYGTGEK